VSGNPHIDMSLVYLVINTH